MPEDQNPNQPNLNPVDPSAVNPALNPEQPVPAANAPADLPTLGVDQPVIDPPADPPVADPTPPPATPPMPEPAAPTSPVGMDAGVADPNATAAPAPPPLPEIPMQPPQPTPNDMGVASAPPPAAPPAAPPAPVGNPGEPVGPAWMRTGVGESTGGQSLSPGAASAVPAPWQTPEAPSAPAAPQVEATTVNKEGGFPVIIFVVIIIAILIAIGLFLFVQGALPF